MSDRRDDAGAAVAVETPEVDWIVACQVCGAPQRPGAPILCRACGEPVLVWGWVP